MFVCFYCILFFKCHFNYFLVPCEVFYNNKATWLPYMYSNTDVHMYERGYVFFVFTVGLSVILLYLIWIDRGAA